MTEPSTDESSSQESSSQESSAGELSISRSAWLSHNLKTLSLVSLLQDSASELLYPILPLYLTAVLGAPVAVVAVIEGVADGIAAITKVASGRLADRWRRRPLVAGGYTAAAVGKVLIAIATTWPIVLAARAVDRLGKGIRGAPRDARLPMTSQASILDGLSDSTGPSIRLAR